MNNDLSNKIITITGIEQKVTTNGKNLYKIKDQDNKSYQLWKTKQDGTDSVAYQNMVSLPNNGLNQTVKIAYREQQSTYQDKPITYRSIVTMEVSTEPVSTTVNNIAKSRIGQKDDEEKWNNISFGKCKHAYLLEAFKNGGDLKNAEPIAEKWADASMRRLKKDELPEPEDEIKIEDIPF